MFFVAEALHELGRTDEVCEEDRYGARPLLSRHGTEIIGEPSAIRHPCPCAGTLKKPKWTPLQGYLEGSGQLVFSCQWPVVSL